MSIIASDSSPVKGSRPECAPEAESFADALLSAVERTAYEDAWECGRCCGYAGDDDAQPPAEWPEQYREVWTLGFLAGVDARWDEVDAWREAHSEYLRSAGFFDDFGGSSGRAFPDDDREFASGDGGHPGYPEF